MDQDNISNEIPNQSLTTSTPNTLTTNKNNLNWRNNLLRASFQTTATIGAVVGACFPIEYYQTRKQLKMPISKKDLVSPTFWLANSQFIRNGLITSGKNGAVRNTILTNRESVHSHVDEVINEHGPNTLHQENRKQTLGLGATAVLIASLNTALTQKNANRRVMADMGIPAPTFKNIGNGNNSIFKNFFDAAQNYRKFLKVGRRIRFTSSFTSAGCYITLTNTDAVQSKLNYLAPTSDYPYVNKMAGTLATAGLCGVLLNGLDVTYKYQVKNMNKATFATPGVLATFKNLLKTEGPRVFFRGSLIGVTCTATAFTAIQLVDGLCNQIFNQNDAVDAEQSAKMINKPLNANVTPTVIYTLSKKPVLAVAPISQLGMFNKNGSRALLEQGPSESIAPKFKK